MDYMREKLEPKRKRKDITDSGKKAKNDDPHASFLISFMREAEESIELKKQ